MSSLTGPLQRKFAQHRLVFWYDDQQELRKEFETIEIEGVEKIEIENNEFGIKYRVLREQPQQKFLIYKAGPQPPDTGNWLLDVQLAHDTFRTDAVSQTLDELGLPIEFRNLVEQHQFFFNAERRKTALKEMLENHDTEAAIRLKMLAVCTGSDPRVDSVVEYLLDEAVDPDKTERLDRIVKSGLDGFLWERLRREFNYQADSPSVQDFVIELFQSCYAMGTDQPAQLGAEAHVFLKRWMDSYRHRESFAHHSRECVGILGIESKLQNEDFRDLIELDYFHLIDQKILSELARQVLDQSISAGECRQIVRRRRNTHWYNDFENTYEAVENASQLFHLLANLEFQFHSLTSGVDSYRQSFFQVDQTYRKFLLHHRRCQHKSLLQPLYGQVCTRYSNKFLLPLNDRWQQLLDEADGWQIPNAVPQRQFFAKFAKPFVRKGNKIFVLISDALRYEIGEELCRRIREEDKYESEIECMVTGLPSYTQLGMASLLPHESLEIQGGAGSAVLVDGQNSQGTANRDKIVKAASGTQGLAIQAEDFASRSPDERRQLTKDHELVYLYHNRIDKIGHDRGSEREVFEATEQALDELVDLVKKLANANVTNLLITSDHGFLYQDEVDESDFSSADPAGGEILKKDRRFVIGRNLTQESGVTVYSAEQLGLQGDLQVMIPKSINRFRQSGAAIRFVHGGSTLQEIVVPVLQVKKGRSTDITSVGVNLVPSSTSIITAGQLAVVLYQEEPVTEKLRPRILRIGLYAPDGMLISDSHEIPFDFESENPREREQKVRLVLSKSADGYNGQQVELRLEEPVPRTNHFKLYKSISYTLRRSFTSDFDDFG